MLTTPQLMQHNVNLLSFPSSLIAEPSSLFHVMVGGGTPEAEQLSSTSSPSAATTSLLLALSLMDGGTGEKKRSLLVYGSNLLKKMKEPLQLRLRRNLIFSLLREEFEHAECNIPRSEWSIIPMIT